MTAEMAPSVSPWPAKHFPEWAPSLHRVPGSGDAPAAPTERFVTSEQSEPKPTKKLCEGEGAAAPQTPPTQSHRYKTTIKTSRAVKRPVGHFIGPMSTFSVFCTHALSLPDYMADGVRVPFFFALESGLILNFIIFL